MEKEQGHYERLMLSFKAMGAGLWDYDIDADSIFCDSRWYEILGLDERKTPVLCIADFKPHIHPDDIKIATGRDFDTISGLLARDARYDVEFRIVRPNGEVRWVRSVASLVVNGETGHRRAVGCVTDITAFRVGRPALLPLSPVVSVEGGAGENGVVEASEAADAPSDKLDLHGLSTKERECLMWVSLGKTAWETATIIERSRRTVEFHLENAVRKLGASNKVHAVVIAIRSGYL